MNVSLILPILLPLLTAVLSVFLRRRAAMAHGLAVGGAMGHLAAALYLFLSVLENKVVVLWVGGWPAPYGICLVADYLSSVMVLITAVIHSAITIYSIKDIDREMVGAGFHSLLAMLTGAICGAFLTGDLFNLYVWFEVMLMASFGLLVMGHRACQLTGAVKYVTINLLSTLFFISAIGLIYGLTGTLNLADLHGKVLLVENSALLTGTAMLLLMAFAIKAALFPLFFWLPASYHTLPFSVSGYFAGMLSKVGIYALIRLFTLVFATEGDLPHTALLVIASLTMLFGVVGAASQMEIRRILSFHIISQVGYMALGLALLTPLALAGAIVYLIHHIIVKANLFLISGVVREVGGTLYLPRIGGIYRNYGLLSIAFFIPAFALAGFPPLSGFWAKLLIIQAALGVEQYGLALLAAVVGLLTVFSMVKIWSEAFWKAEPAEADAAAAGRRLSGWMLAPIIALATTTVIMGLCMEPVIRFALAAAEQLLDPQDYINAVLGGQPMSLFILNIIFAVVFTTLLASGTITTFFAGFLLGYVALWLSKPLYKDTRYFRKLPKAINLMVFFLVELVLSNFKVLWDIVTPSHINRPGIVGVPLTARSDLEIFIVANLISLTPGSLSVDLSEDRKILYVHIMFLDDPEKTRRSIKTGLERRVLEVMRT